MLIVSEVAQEEDRYPYWQSPVVVPKSPVLPELKPEIPPPSPPPQPPRWLYWLGFGAVVFFAGRYLAGRPRSEAALTGTLYAFWIPKQAGAPQRVPMEDWQRYVLMQQAGQGTLRFIEADSISEAKEAALAGDGARMQRGQRLYYMWGAPEGWEAKSIPGSQLEKYIERAITTAGSLFYVWADSADHARELIKTGRIRAYRPGIYEVITPEPPKTKREPTVSRKPVQMTFFGQDLQGPIMNCGVWLVNEYTGRPYCAKYGPACAAQRACAPAARGQSKACIKTKQVRSNPEGRYRGKLITRCAKYAAACATACLPESMPRPEPPKEPEISEKEVEAIAKGLAQEYNLIQEEAGPALARDIMARGGIRSYRKGHLKEEYIENVPLFMRRKAGLPLDEMASEMGVDEATLIKWLQQAYPKGRKVERRKSWKDFIDYARDIVMEEHRAGLRGLGQEQKEFWKLKRELVLTPQDVATSDDPLEICLQRAGWDLDRVRELQASIAEKLTPDIFTQKTTPLSPSEKELQRYIDQCLKAITAGAGKAGEQLKLFGLRNLRQEHL